MILINPSFDTAHRFRALVSGKFEVDQGKEIMDAIKLYDRVAEPAILAWVFILFLIWLLFTFGRDIIAAVLMKLYEVLIRRSPVG